MKSMFTARARLSQWMAGFDVSGPMRFSVRKSYFLPSERAAHSSQRHFT